MDDNYKPGEALDLSRLTPSPDVMPTKANALCGPASPDKPVQYRYKGNYKQYVYDASGIVCKKADSPADYKDDRCDV